MLEKASAIAKVFYEDGKKNPFLELGRWDSSTIWRKSRGEESVRGARPDLQFSKKYENEKITKKLKEK